MLRHIDCKNYFLDNIYHNLNIDFNKEGIDHINISLKSNHMIGKLLSPMFNHMFKTFLGYTCNIQQFLYAVTKPGYDMKYLTKQRVSREEKEKIIKMETIKLPNYYALVAYALCEMIKQNIKLQTMLKNNNLQLTYYLVHKKPRIMDTHMERYLNICIYIQYMIKNNIFNQEHIEYFICKCKENSTKSFMDDIACNI